MVVALVIYSLSAVCAYGLVTAYLRGHPYPFGPFMARFCAVIIALTGPIGLAAALLGGDIKHGWKL